LEEGAGGALRHNLPVASRGGKFMENKKTHLKRRIFSEERIPFLEGRPERECAISRDDIVDLAIILNTKDAVEDIVAALG
jgi:hypothetical protein